MMTLAIKQKITVKNGDDFNDWLAGQKAIANTTGFLFAVYESNLKCFAFYKFHRDGKDVLPSLKSGQSYVYLGDNNDN